MKVFVDGSAGTTGLEIVNRLEKRTDLTLVTLSDERRKDPAARKDAILSSDLTVLCLPDEGLLFKVIASLPLDLICNLGYCVLADEGMTRTFMYTGRKDKGPYYKADAMNCIE